MKRIPILFLSAALATVTALSSCADNNGTRPLTDAGGNSIPRDDGELFRPGTPKVGKDAPIDKKGDATSSAKTHSDDQGPNSPVPEPLTLFLVGAGLAGAALLRRRRPEDLIESE